MKITRRTFLKYGTAAVLAGTGYGTLVEPGRLTLEQVKVHIRLLPDALAGLRIAVIGDFHLHPYTTIGHVKDAVALANSIQPDLTVMLGDYVDSTVDAIHELAPELAKLNARLGVFGILGNHDHRPETGSSVVEEAMRKAGIPLLVNSGVTLADGAGQFYLAGNDSAFRGHDDLARALEARHGDLPTVLLAHEPDFADHVEVAHGIGLQLSGHSHGGQVRIPFLGAVELPRWAKRYDMGLYNASHTQVYVNRGVGLAGLPVRVNCPPEITEITLQPA